MSKHNPIQFANSLSSKLASKSRHVCVFLGAGAASACGLPDVDQLEEQILTELGDESQQALEAQLEDRTLEQTLSRLRRIASLLEDEQTLDGMSEEEANQLDEQICHAIVNSLDIENADLEPMLDFASWAARVDYNRPLEVFTVNYDLLLESAFEQTRVPYFDGFSGNLRSRFQPDFVERTKEARGDDIPSYFVRLWKVHGSVNWEWEQDQVLRLGQPVRDEAVAAIYPSDTKYDESRRVPFVVLQDRLRRALHEDESLVLISGYSFGDDHLNEMIFNAATRCERCEYIAFCYSGIPEDLANRAEKTPNLQVLGPEEAIIGGVKSQWEDPEESPDNVWQDEKFQLRDFSDLASYLAKSQTSNQGDGTTDDSNPIGAESRDKGENHGE